MANHLQADKTSEVDEGPQTPQMVARAADVTRYLLYSDPDPLHTAKRSLDGPNPWSSRLTKNLHRC